ncbi:DUF2147 domain-containing protein [Brevundimonas subvibrioides]|jgi:uncharacterized protein (DUF2147 family)|uniref:DUF2147 domain-containing protein n=1 Tax=Brevundimonas subvibrioides (strain ATCC 15264 / DSM 4735 / LMG 14903 / NBRC 16000 / CB 81) TaxID=633149 RepID=D9QGX1_BRESC|nr:DUF2147 domain-containing protein [Brevundimonas subvibrioides]ADL00937.1 Protein of unknown function DUF2147 [Brevundimonas subvibrioides ATCC 15264]
MIRPLALAALAMSTLAAPAMAQSTDPTGLWQTPTNGGQVRIARCGQALCGTLVTSNNIRSNPGLLDENNSNRALRTRTIRNVQLLSGFTGGPTEWRGGQVYNPEDGRTYRGTITLTNPNTLNLRGCVVAPLCRNQTWTRVR